MSNPYPPTGQGKWEPSLAVLRAAKEAGKVASPAVVSVLEEASESALLSAWKEGVPAASTGWLLAASASYQEASALVASELVEGAAEGGERLADVERGILALVRAADACASLGGRLDMHVRPLLASVAAGVSAG